METIAYIYNLTTGLYRAFYKVTLYLISTITFSYT